MAYNFGQFRRSQLASYSTSLTYTLDTIQETSPLSEAVIFNERVIDLDGDNVLNAVDSTGTIQRCYYIRYKIYKKWDTTQVITLKLINTLKEEDNEQTLTTFTVTKGYESDYSYYDFVIAPNATYNRIEFFLNRIVDDYNSVNDDDTYGRTVEIEIDRLEEITNITTYLNSAIDNKGQFQQIGIQGPPGLQMCIDGESIKIGRSGIYEINNGTTIKFIGFIVQEDDGQYFMMDYQY